MLFCTAMTRYISIIFMLSTIITNSSHGYEFQNLQLKRASFPQEGLRTSRQSAPAIDPQASLSNDNVLLQYVKAIIGNKINEIGEAQTRPLLLNQQIGGGVLNFSGFTWNKPEGNIQVYANRELSPDLYSDNFLVHDTLTILIDANTYLSQLRDSDMIDISDANPVSYTHLTLPTTPYV